MNEEVDYKNNPLHGLGLKALLTDVVSHYGFDILHAYLGFHCFGSNPSLESSIKFLKKNAWAREKVEAFYLYQYKNLPRATDDQFELPPRDRIIPNGQSAKEPAVLSLEDAERLREKRNKKTSNHRSKQREGMQNKTPKNHRPKKQENSPASQGDPWASWKQKNL